MAPSHSQISCIVFFFIVLQVLLANCTQFEVGAQDGWGVPKSKDDQVYNKWASQQRFKIGDTLRFTYKKDSVILVTEEEFNKCNSSHPMFFSNNGDTVFKFDRSGLFYFISGVTGHCEKGEKMIIKVLEAAQAPLSADSTHEQKSAAKGITATTKITMMLLICFFVHTFSHVISFSRRF